jgi:S-adenosylmethionine hydrolase
VSVDSFPIITLLTDFGSRDTYVGQMKGAILAIAPAARLVDMTHELPAGDILAGSLAWMDSVAAFPPGTIHVGVVDPGVGGERRGIAAEIGPWRFVFPDNGLATALLQSHTLHRAVELDEPRYWRPAVSPVFHGRDIFGPVAAHWAAGVALEEFGPALASPLVEWELPRPVIENGVIRGCVLTSDRFGNLRTNIPGKEIVAAASSRRCTSETPLPPWTVEIGSVKINGISSYFAETPTGQFCAVIGSHGHLEIAMNQGNAQLKLNALRGTPVIVR